MELYINKIIQGDCLEVIKTLPENSIDSIVTDPPYELGFMGKSWDNTGIANNVELWKECLRVLKPGGHILSFSGTRTYHRMACAIEDAGFEVRDMIEWVMGSGFPKSLNVFKQLEKRCDCGIMIEYGERTTKNTKHYLRPLREADIQKAKHLTEEQREALFKGLPKQGLPTEEVGDGLFISERAGQPSMEGRCYLFQKEGQLYRCAICKMSTGVFSDGEKGWLYNGAPTCNGDAYRQTSNEDGSSASREPQSRGQQDREPCAFCKQFGAQAIRAYGWGSAMKPAHEPICVARKPLSEANISDNFLKWGTGGINIDESRVEANWKEERPESWFKSGKSKSGNPTYDGNLKSLTESTVGERLHDAGRFPANLITDGSEEVRECFPESSTTGKRTLNSQSKNKKQGDSQVGWHEYRSENEYTDSGNASRFFKSIIYQAKASKRDRGEGNNHATVKPTALMEYLIKMITPQGGTVLDPFAGSGSTLVAAKQNGYKYIGIEKEEDYIKIAEARIKAQKQTKLF